MEKILVTICARGGSKGIPGKNIRLLNNKPLIAYTIEHALEFSKNHDAVIELSTDSIEIREVAAKLNLRTTYLRPAALATDTAGKIGVLNDILNYSEVFYKTRFDVLLDLDITSPLRNQQDLENALEVLRANSNAINLFSVSPPHRNPYFNMVEKGSDGFFKLVKQGNFKTRQESPPVYDMNASFYYYKRDFFEKGLNSAITEKSLAYEMKHLCFDLDSSIDFEFMSWLLANKKLDFNFIY